MRSSNKPNNDFDRHRTLEIEDAVENVSYSKIQSQVLECIQKHSPIRDEIIGIIEEKHFQEKRIDFKIARIGVRSVIILLVVFLAGLIIPIDLLLTLAAGIL